MRTLNVKTSLLIFESITRHLCATSQFPSGVEYAEAMSKLGKSKRVDSSEYKVKEYYTHNKWSFYDMEKQLGKYRLPQPKPGEPDAPRTTSTTASKKS